MLKPQIYSVKSIGLGLLSVMAKPVTGEWIEDEFLGIAQAGVNIMVSLLEIHEAYELGLQREKELVQKNGMDFLSFPIADRGVPTETAEFTRICEAVFQQIRSGSHAVVHCRGGIGRTGLFSAAVLMFDGMDVTDALELISDKRRVPVPDTEEQIDWLKQNQRLFSAP